MKKEEEQDQVCNMVFLKTHMEIDIMRESSLLVARTHAELAKVIRPGITSLYLDSIAEEFIRDNGGIPGFKGYNDFPYTLWYLRMKKLFMVCHQ